jgi:hypothetical protein
MSKYGHEETVLDEGAKEPRTFTTGERQSYASWKYNGGYCEGRDGLALPSEIVGKGMAVDLLFFDLDIKAQAEALKAIQADPLCVILDEPVAAARGGLVTFNGGAKVAAGTVKPTLAAQRTAVAALTGSTVSSLLDCHSLPEIAVKAIQYVKTEAAKPVAVEAEPVEEPKPIGGLPLPLPIEDVKP